MSAGAAIQAEDVRERGAWTRRQAWKNDLIVVVVRVLVAALVPLSPRVLRAFGRTLGLFVYYALPGTRRMAKANATRALASRLVCRTATATARQAYLALGEHLGDALASLDDRRALAPLPLDSAALDVFGRLGVARRGVVFASAHLGPWERVAATLVTRGVPITAVAREPYDPRLAWVYDRLRNVRGVSAIYRGLPGAPTRMVRVLRSGGVLGIPMDLRSRVPSLEVSFLGQPALVPLGPARLALRTGAAVVVGTVAPDSTQDEGLRITCTEIPSADLAATEEGELLLTQRIADELSARIWALPGQWVWMHDRFPPIATVS